MFKFYLPFYYLFYSRLKTTIDMISWIIIFIIPQFFITYMYADLNLGAFVLLFLLSQIIFNTLYEVGYIENDISTTENEKEPTLRLDEESTTYIKNNYSKIIYFRYFIVLFSIALLYWVNSYFQVGLNITAFVVLLMVNRIFFFFHNSIRNRWNLVTFSVLAVSKYIFPIVLFACIEDMIYPIILSIMIFPVLRIIEHSTHRRYTFEIYAKVVGNHDKFRVYYYSCLVVMCIILYSISMFSKFDFIISIILLIYFLVYRVSSYMMLRKGLYRRDTLKNKDLYSEHIS